MSRDLVQTSGGVVVELLMIDHVVSLRMTLPFLPPVETEIELPGINPETPCVVCSVELIPSGKGWRTILWVALDEHYEKVTEATLRAAGWGDPSDEPTFVAEDATEVERRHSARGKLSEDPRRAP